jgi:hypothetical protein
VEITRGVLKSVALSALLWNEPLIGETLSLKEIIGPLLAKVKYHQKERKVHFQNNWDRAGTCFPFYIVEIPTIRFTRKEVIINIPLNRRATDQVLSNLTGDNHIWRGRLERSASCV